MNSSRAVGDILVFTFVNLRDNIAYTENRKYIVLVKSKKYGCKLVRATKQSKLKICSK